MSLGDMLLGEAVATARERDIAARQVRQAQASGAGQATATGMAIGFGIRAQRAEQLVQDLESELNEAEAHASGLMAICKALIAELEELSQGNRLLDKAQRVAIYDAAYAEELAQRQAAEDA